MRPFMAKRPATCRWLSASTDTAHSGCSASRSSMREPFRRLTSTSGGSRETDMKAVAVMPTSSTPGASGSSGTSGGSCAVTRTTPEDRRDIAARNSSLLTPSACPEAAGAVGEGVFSTPETLVCALCTPHRASARAGS